MCVASSPEVNTYMSDRIKATEYHAIHYNFRKLSKTFIFIFFTPTASVVKTAVSGYSPAGLG